MSFRKTIDFVAKFLFFLGFAALATLARAESFSVTVTGSVMNSEGMPVGAVDIVITTIFEDSTFYFATATTDQNGVYLETIPVPDGQTEGVISISSIGCNGAFTYFTRSWTLNNSVVIQDFIWCDIMNFGDSCVVLILPNIDPITGITSLYAVSSAPEPVDYVWSDGSTNQSVMAMDTGLFCVTITGANDCSATSCYAYGIDTMDCFVTVSPGNGGIDDNTLTAVAFGVAPMTYLWSTGDTTQLLYVGETGTFCVTVTDGLGCESQGCYDYVTGIRSILQGDMSVAPQPVLDYCRVTIPDEIKGPHMLVITGMNGASIKRYNDIFRNGTEAILDVGDLVPGIYIMKMQLGQEIWLCKLIKHFN